MQSIKQVFTGMLLVFALTANAKADIIFDQSVLPNLADGAESTLDDQPSGIESADNFFISQTTTLTSLSWWGVYDPVVPTGDDFILRIFSDLMATPLLEITNLMPLRTDTGALDGFGAPIYEYTTNALSGLQLASGDYFLSLVNVVNVQPDFPIWFWTQGVGSSNNNYFRTVPGGAWDEIASPDPGGFDLAFLLEGELDDVSAIPIPSTAWLVLPMAGLLLHRRRRQRL